MNFYTFDHTDDYAHAATRAIEKVILETLSEKPDVNVAISGGSSPLPVYEKWSELLLPWNRINFFLVDERHVSLHSDLNNARNLELAFKGKIDQSKEFVFFDTSKSPKEAVDEYEKNLRARGDFQIDLALMGLGSDGHTASLFPGSPGVHEKEKWALATKSPDPETPDRLTMTFPVLLNAKKVFFLIRGASKKEKIMEWLSGKESIDQIPATAFLNHPQLKVYYDQS